jgi:hypothetical protein
MFGVSVVAAVGLTGPAPSLVHLPALQQHRSPLPSMAVDLHDETRLAHYHPAYVHYVDQHVDALNLPCHGLIKTKARSSRALTVSLIGGAFLMLAKALPSLAAFGPWYSACAKRAPYITAIM